MSQPGVLVAVVGPSGAGKDSLISAARRALARDPRLLFARRVITRPDDPSEPHDVETPERFAERAAAGEFALWWTANGLSYGLPGAVAEAIEDGLLVVANVSRESVGDARARFPRVLVVHVTAKPETLAARLASRAREDDDAREARLARTLLVDQATNADVRIENDGELAEASARFLAVLKPLLPIAREPAR